MMTVAELRAALAALPDDAPVLAIECGTGRRVMAIDGAQPVRAWPAGELGYRTDLSDEAPADAGPAALVTPRLPREWLEPVTPPRRSSLAPCDVPRASSEYPGYCTCGHPMAEHRERFAPGRIGAEVPGSPLVLTVDTGGERWTLDGRPLHAGDRVEVLADVDRMECERCEGSGRVLAAARPVNEDEDEAPPWASFGGEDANEYEDWSRTPTVACSDCRGRGYTFEALWLPALFEYVNAGDGSGVAYLYPPIFGALPEERHAIHVRRGDGVRCRWPAPSRPSK